MSASKLKNLLKRGFYVSLAGYAISSVVLLYNPQLLTRTGICQLNPTRDQLIGPTKKTLICAHRCGAYDNLENTVPAAIAAIKNGAHILQVDVKATKDGALVLNADEDLSRLCKIGRFTWDFMFKDLPKIAAKEVDIPYMVSSDGKQEMYQIKKGDSQKITTLEELLSNLERVDKDKKVWLYINLYGDLAMVKETQIILKKYKREENTLWQHPLVQLQEVDSNIKRVATSQEFSILFLLYITGLLSFQKKLTFDCLYQPVLTPSFKKMLMHKYGSSRYFDNKDGDNWKYRANLFLQEQMDRFSGPMLRHLSKRGILIIRGVVDTRDEYKMCQDNGISDCIVTDRPLLLKECIQQNLSP